MAGEPAPPLPAPEHAAPEDSARAGCERRLARYLSLAFQPVLTATYVLISATIAGASSPGQAVFWGLVVLTLGVGVPLANILARMRTREDLTFDLLVRGQRRQPLLVTLACAALTFALALAGQAPRPLALALGAGLTCGLPLTLITLRWRVSLHAGGVASALVVLAFLFGPAAALLLPLLPAVGWSRLVLRRHSPAQVLAGSVVGGLASLAYLLFAGAG